MSKGRFHNMLNDISPTKPLLPLVHTCEALIFRSILEDGRLKPAPCDTFVGEDLLYFFYGRPSYRVSEDIKRTKITSKFPVCFILEGAHVDPKRLFPLDSGALSRNRFKDYIHSKMSVNSFSLPPELEMAGKIVRFFYGDNRNYYRQKPLDVKFPPTEFEVESYYNLIKSSAEDDFDDRCASIEVQCNQPYLLNKSTVKAVILPESLSKDETVRKILEEDWDADVITYMDFYFNPKEYTAIILNEMNNYLEKHRYFI